MFGKARQATKFYGRVRICFVSHQANCTVESVKIKTGLNLKTGIKLKLIRVKEGLRSYFVLGEWGEGGGKGIETQIPQLTGAVAKWIKGVACEAMPLRSREVLGSIPSRIEERLVFIQSNLWFSHLNWPF